MDEDGESGGARYHPFSLLLDERLRVLAINRLRAGEDQLRPLVELAQRLEVPEPAQPAAQPAVGDRRVQLNRPFESGMRRREPILGGKDKAANRFGPCVPRAQH